MKKIYYLIFFLVLSFVNINVFAAFGEEINVCNQETVKAFIFIGKIISILKIAVPLIIIVFGMIDFFRAIFSNDEKAVKVSFNALLRRIIAGIIIFIVPSVIYMILDLMIKDFDEYNNEFVCSKCILKVSECDNDFVESLPENS